MIPVWKEKQHIQRRIALVVIGVILLLLAVGTLISGNLFYRDWRGLNAFAPIEGLIGLFLVGIGVFGFRKQRTRN
jgi:predicted transporter